MPENNEFHNRIKSIANNIISKLNIETEKVSIWSEGILYGIEIINKRLIEFDTEIAKLQKNHENAISESKQLQGVLAEKNEELCRFKTELKFVEDKYEALTKEFENLQIKCQEMKKQTDISPHDAEVLNLARKKLKIYKEFTKIKFDYTVPLVSSVTGYISNSSNGYLRAFEFNRDDLTHQELVEELWKEVEMATEEDWSDIFEATGKSIEAKENIPNNVL